MSQGRAVFWGSLAGVLVVIILAAVAALAGIGRGTAPTDAGNGPVLVALVLPDSDGTVVPRVIDLYQGQGSARTVTSISPTTPAVISGTAGSTVADAYTFGGGPGLLAAVALATRLRPTHWVVIDLSNMVLLQGGASMALRIPADMEVFDGSRLYSFSATQTSIPVKELPQLMDGVRFLSAEQATALRVDVGNTVAAALASAPTSGLTRVRSDLSVTALRNWLRGIGSAKRVTRS